MEVTPMQMAYGLLWREMRISDRPYTRRARAILLATLTTKEQYDAIAWAKARYPIAEKEVVWGGA